jgi:hypothetical protein
MILEDGTDLLIQHDYFLVPACLFFLGGGGTFNYPLVICQLAAKSLRMT